MNNFRFLVLFGLLALSQAKPEAYSYQKPQPAILPQQSHQQGYSYQQPQPQFNVQPQPQFNVQPQQPQFVQVQQPQPQFTVQQQQPQFNVQQQHHHVQVQQPQPQFTVQQHSEQGYSYQQPQPQVNVQPQFNVQQPQPQFNVQQPQPQFNVQQPQPQLNVHIPLPQGNINNFQSALQESLPQIPVQLNQADQSNSFQQFNQQSSFQNNGQEGFGQNNFADQQQSLVTKHISIHVAPEDPEEVAQFNPQPLPVRKNYKIIFIKAPTVGLSRSQIIAQQAQHVQEKTLVYVLVNKPQQSEFVLPTAAPAPVSKPEVYFIKYKSNSNGNGASFGNGLGDSSSAGAGLPVVEDIARGQGQGLVNSGESSSSLFSGGLPAPAPQYGVPGYQKRSTKN